MISLVTKFVTVTKDSSLKTYFFVVQYREEAKPMLKSDDEGIEYTSCSLSRSQAMMDDILLVAYKYLDCCCQFLIVLNISKSEHFHQVRQQAAGYHQANSRCRV